MHDQTSYTKNKRSKQTSKLFAVKLVSIRQVKFHAREGAGRILKLAQLIDYKFSCSVLLPQKEANVSLFFLTVLVLTKVYNLQKNS